VDKPITETVTQPVAPVDSTPSVAIEQKEDVPSEGAAKPVAPIDVEKKAEASGVASPLASPALDASASPSKAGGPFYHQAGHLKNAHAIAIRA
jgi:hypothetical protein